MPLYFLPTSDGGLHTNVAAVGRPSYYQCMSEDIPGNPQYVQFSPGGSPASLGFYLTETAANTDSLKYGSGTASIYITFVNTGDMYWVLYNAVGAVLDQQSFPVSSTFTRAQFTTPAIVGRNDGLAMAIWLTTGTGKVSYVEVDPPCWATPEPVLFVKPLDFDDAIGGGVCTRTHLWMPKHALVTAPNGRRYWRKANPPQDGEPSTVAGMK